MVSADECRREAGGQGLVKQKKMLSSREDGEEEESGLPPLSGQAPRR